MVGLGKVDERAGGFADGGIPMADVEDDVRVALGWNLTAIQIGTILWVAAAATLVLVSVPGALSSLVATLTGSAFSTTTSLVIAGIILAFGLYIVWASRRNLRYRIHAKIEEARRETAEMTIEQASRTPILR